MTAVLPDRALLRDWRTASTLPALAEVYRQLHGLAPVLGTPWQAVLVTGHAACRELLTDPGTWRVPDAADFQRLCGQAEADRPARHGVNQTLFHLNGTEHTARRRVLAPFFTPRALAARTAVVDNVVRATVRDFADRVVGEGVADAVEHLAGPIAGTVMCSLLGVSPRDQDFITRMAADLSFVEELAPRPSHLARADAAITELYDYAGRLIRTRAYRPDGLLAYLLNWADSGQEAHDEVVRVLVLMITAGVSTSISVLASTVLALCRLPGLDSPPAEFVDECLRWDPPAHMVGRIAERDTTVAGVQIAEGTLAHVLIGAANRDPAAFAEPEVFSPGRTQTRSLTFSAGPHYCLGAGLARLQAIQLVSAWREGAAGLTVAEEEPPRMTGPNFRHLRRLPCSADHRFLIGS